MRKAILFLISDCAMVQDYGLIYNVMYAIRNK